MANEQCSNCHQFISSDGMHAFCTAECVHEWSAKLINAETPKQIWEIVHLVELLGQADSNRRAIISGKLIQLSRSIWPPKEKRNG